MRGGILIALSLLACGPVAVTRLRGQQSPPVQQTQPPAQTQTPPASGSSGTIDPTKDPTKDPATDPTRDPTKDPDAATQSNGGANAVGADAPGGAVDAPDYTGPAILSRSFALSRPSIPRNERFRFYVGLNAIYDSGLLGTYIQNAPITSTNSYGGELNWGVNGKHYRRKDIFELNYNGHYYDYGGGSRYNGQDESLSAGYTREVSRRFTFGIRESAGLYSNTYSVLNSTVLSDVSQASSTIVVAPNTEAFDDRTYFSTTSASFTYRKTARLSFNVGAAYFLVRRDSIYLGDTNGYAINADVAYRVSRRQTTGVYYSHTQFSFRKLFGDGDADSVGANYAISLTRRMDLSIRAGGTRYSSQSLGAVVPNPLVQQVLGIQAGIEKFYFVGYAPDVTVTLNRSLRQSTLGASFVEGITPGNGLVLTSKHQAESIFWTPAPFHRIVTQFGGGRDVLSGYAGGTGIAGDYTSYYLRLSLMRPVTRAISSYMNFDYRQYGFGGTSLHQNEYRIAIGFRYSPGEGLTKLW